MMQNIPSVLAGGFGLSLDCDEDFRRLVDMPVRGLQSYSVS